METVIILNLNSAVYVFSTIPVMLHSLEVTYCNCNEALIIKEFTVYLGDKYIGYFAEHELMTKSDHL